MSDLTARITGLTEAIEAQLADDEAAAKAASSEHLCPDARAGQWQHVGIRHVRYDNGAGETMHAVDVTGGPGLWYEQIWVKGDPDSAVTIHIARQDPASTLRRVKATRDLVAAIIAEPHDWNPLDEYYSCSQARENTGTLGLEVGAPGSGCSDPDRAGQPCDCGRDQRVARLLGMIAAQWSDEDSPR